MGSGTDRPGLQTPHSLSAKSLNLPEPKFAPLEDGELKACLLGLFCGLKKML